MSMSIELRFACALLATWRLTHLLTAVDGPADVVVRVRAFMGHSVVGRAMDCFYCLSIWMAAPLAPFVSSDPLEWVVAWLALSGGACLLERVTTRTYVQHTTARMTREGDLDELLWRTAPGADVVDGAAAAAQPLPARSARGDVAVVHG